MKLWQPAQEDEDEEVDVMDENTNKAEDTAAENISQAVSSDQQRYPDYDAFRSTSTDQPSPEEDAEPPGHVPPGDRVTNSETQPMNASPTMPPRDRRSKKIPARFKDFVC